MIGRTLSHYRILEPLGEGGMGVVYRAHDLNLERDVALKVLPALALVDEASRRRFRREAHALSRLNHPNIATIHDFGSEEGIDFLVMELVEADPLDRLLGVPLPESKVIDIGIQIARALEAAHERGVVHRDLKPANVMRSAKGHVKVLDFGLARLLHSATDVTKDLSESGVTMGTISYMAPEQLLARSADERADLYSLGVILYELAVGHSPYRETAPTALVYEIVNEPLRSPRSLNGTLTERFERVVLRCLEKEPGARYASASELIAELAGDGDRKSVV